MNLLNPIGLLLCAIYLLTMLASYISVETKYQYYTINKGKEVVLRVYGKNVVTALFDRDKKLIKRAIRVRPLSTFDRFILRKENIGPLKLEPREEGKTKSKEVKQ